MKLFRKNKKKGYIQVKPKHYRVSGSPEKNTLEDVIGIIALFIFFLFVRKLRSMGFTFL